MRDTNNMPGERRRIELYDLVNNKVFTTRNDLAKHFGVSIRTINKDINRLKERWGVEIINDPITNEYKIVNEEELDDYELINGSYTESTADKLQLKEKQVSLILASLVASRKFMPTEIGLIQESLLKSLSYNEAAKLRKLYQLNDRPIVEEDYIFNNIEKVRQAILQERKIKFAYINAKDKLNIHIVTPFSFACELGKYYVIAKPEKEEKLFHYRMDRVKNLEVLHNQKGEATDKFNINDYLRKTWYMQGGPEEQVIVKFKDQAYKVVSERNMQEGKLLRRVEGEYFYYKFTVNGLSGIFIWLMGFGGDAMILRPKRLRDMVKKQVKEMYELYQIKKD